jgi:hypothetical protein
MNDPACPECGRDLQNSSEYPRGTSADGTFYQAKSCSKQRLWFGRAPDGTWSIPLRPLHRR